MKFSERYRQITESSTMKPLIEYPKHTDVERFLNVRRTVLRTGVRKDREYQEEQVIQNFMSMHKVSKEQAEKWLADWRKNDNELLKKERENQERNRNKEDEPKKKSDDSHQYVAMMLPFM